jgi:hypothetical protein
MIVVHLRVPAVAGLPIWEATVPKRRGGTMDALGKAIFKGLERGMKIPIFQVIDL